MVKQVKKGKVQKLPFYDLKLHHHLFYQKNKCVKVLCHLSSYNESDSHLSSYNEFDRFFLLQCSCQRLHLVQCLLQLIIILYLHRVDQKPSLTQYYTVILIPDKHSTKQEIFCTAQLQHKRGEGGSTQFLTISKKCFFSNH